MFFKKGSLPIILMIVLLMFSACTNGSEDIYNIVVDDTPAATEKDEDMSTPKPIIDHSQLDMTKLELVGNFIQSEVDQGFPGAVLMVMHKGELVYSGSYGYAKYYDGLEVMDDPQPMTEDTYFDLASLTKIYGTTFAIMKLVDSGVVSLSDTAGMYLSGFDGEKASITIEMLLRHNAGFPADIRFFDPSTEDFYSKNKSKTKSLLSSVELSYTPGTDYIYSDIGFMILGAIVESASGQSFEKYLLNNIYKPLGIQGDITFKPLDNGISADEIAATERMGNTRDGTAYFEGIRDYTLQGEVHDEKAYYSMGGVSGHAGLFSNAETLCILSQLLVDGGSYNDVEIFSKETVDLFTTINDDKKYQLGFWQAGAQNGVKDTVPAHGLFNTGWTGVSSFIDIENEIVIILLTNKRHSVFDENGFTGYYMYETGKYDKIMNMVYEAFTR